MRTSPLKKARGETYSQKVAARLIGVSWRTLVRWERSGFDPGELPLETLERMAVLYGVTLEELVGRPLVSRSA